MSANKIKYSCKNCGWETAIREEWPDLKPKRCMARRCNTSFEKDPEALIIQMPEKVEVKVEQPKYKKYKKSDEQ